MDYHQLHPSYRELTVGDNISLIEPDLEHASASLTWTKDPEVVQFMGGDFSNPTLTGEKKRIEDIRKNADEYSWMIEYDGIVVGNVCINLIAVTTKKFGKKAGNLTILIGNREHWGKGVGSDVCAAVLDWAFQEADFKAMAARALKENTASIRTLQKLGFVEKEEEPYEGLIDGKKTVWRNFVKRL